MFMVMNACKCSGANCIELVSRTKLLSRFSWLPAKLARKMNVLWLVVLAKVFAKQNSLLSSSMKLAPDSDKIIIARA